MAESKNMTNMDCTNEGRKIRARLVKELRKLCSVYEDGKYLQRCYMDPQDGCVPDEYIFDNDLIYAIHNKFYYFFLAIANVAQEKTGNIDIIVKPSYNDHCTVLLYQGRFVLYEYSCKAWHFGGYGYSVAEEMYFFYEKLIENYKEIERRYIACRV